MKDCQFGVSPVNYSDSDSDSDSGNDLEHFLRVEIQLAFAVPPRVPVWCSHSIFPQLKSPPDDSADKHIPSKTSRSVSSVPWITPEIRRKIRKKNETHAKAKRTGSAKIRSKFETLRREIKADIRKQHDLYVNNLVGDVKANPRDFYRYINSQKKDTQGIPPPLEKEARKWSCPIRF